MKNFIIFFLLIIECIAIDIFTAFLSMLIIFVFKGIAILVFNDPRYKESVSVYNTLLVFNFVYASLCFLYMIGHDYTYLFAFDIQKAFLPTTMDFLSSGASYSQVLKDVWTTYDFFSRFQSGYYTFLTFFGYIAKAIGANIYFTLQIASLSVTSFASVFIYRILIIKNIDNKAAVRYALQISILSVLFIYNSVILRDGIVALLYIYVIYVVLSGFSTVNIIKMLIASLIMMTFRIESGLACLIFVPFIFIISNKKNKTALIMLISFVMIGISFFLLQRFSGDVSDVYNNYYDNYAEDVDLQTGLIGHLQRIPLVGPFLSIIFTFLMPIPCWLKLSTMFYNVNMPECYNIMNFPLTISAFFHAYFLTYIVLLFFRKKSCLKNDKYKWIFIPALTLLLLQSTVVESRRVMGLYVVFFVYWAIAHNKSSKKENDLALRIAVVTFAFIQFVAIIL